MQRALATISAILVRQMQQKRGVLTALVIKLLRAINTMLRALPISPKTQPTTTGDVTLTAVAHGADGEIVKICLGMNYVLVE